MKVLVGVDGSSNSFAAVEFVGRLFTPEHDQLVVLFASPAVSFDDERLDPAVAERARSSFSRSILDAAMERLPEGWRSRAEAREVVGSPGTALVETASDVGVDMIAVGFRGTSSLIEHFMLGSVSRNVVSSSTLPVLVVKGNAAAVGNLARSEKKPNLLVAYDSSIDSERMATYLSRHDWPAGCAGLVMTVVRPMFLTDLPDWVKNQPRDPDVAAMASAWENEHQENLAKARAELEQFRQALPSCFAANAVIVAEGRPSEQIVKEATHRAIDLVVLGSRGLGAVKRLLLGSTSEQVLNSAPCSVLIVH
jgi:nucleotide-binding universal stress UspA family protein